MCVFLLRECATERDGDAWVVADSERRCRLSDGRRVSKRFFFVFCPEASSVVKVDLSTWAFKSPIAMDVMISKINCRYRRNRRSL